MNQIVIPCGVLCWIPVRIAFLPILTKGVPLPTHFVKNLVISPSTPFPQKIFNQWRSVHLDHICDGLRFLNFTCTFSVQRDTKQKRKRCTTHTLNACSITSSVFCGFSSSWHDCLPQANNSMQVNTVKVPESDVMATNGVVHFIDSILYPAGKKKNPARSRKIKKL